MNAAFVPLKSIRDRLRSGLPLPGLLSTGSHQPDIAFLSASTRHFVGGNLKVAAAP